MSKDRIDRTLPAGIVPCRSCGEMPRLHYGKDGRWYMDCASICWRTPRSADKAGAITEWNMHMSRGTKHDLDA